MSKLAREIHMNVGSLLYTILAGLLFGVWPIFMNKSGLSGTNAAAAFAVVCSCIVVPAAVYNGISISGSRPGFAIAAGITAGIALLIFNKVLASTPAQDLSPLFVVLLVAQLVPSVVHYLTENGSMPTMKILGIVLAIAAAVLVNWPTPGK